jgi:hypothetical protein
VLTVEMPTDATMGALPSVTVTLVAPSGASSTVPLHTTAAGRAAGLVQVSDVGDYRASIDVTDPGTGWTTRLVRGWYWNGDLEAQARGVNLRALQDIVRRSGGALLPAGPVAATGRNVFDGERRRASREMFTGLLLIAALLLFVDYRRALGSEAHA